MKDEEYLFRQENRERAITARSARHRRTHTGKGGRVKLPSDHMTKKEKNAMNGECKTYRLNDPMKWEEFKTLPEDLMGSYIKALRQRFNCPDAKIAEMMGVHPATFSRYMKTLGLPTGDNRNRNTKWDEAGWYTWLHGMPAPVAEAQEEIPEEAPEQADEATPEQAEKVIQGDTEGCTCCSKEVNRAIPAVGSMSFEGRTEEIMETIKMLLGGANIRIDITWIVPEVNHE